MTRESLTWRDGRKESADDSWAASVVSSFAMSMRISRTGERALGRSGASARAASSTRVHGRHTGNPASRGRPGFPSGLARSSVRPGGRTRPRSPGPVRLRRISSSRARRRSDMRGVARLARMNLRECGVTKEQRTQRRLLEAPPRSTCSHRLRAAHRAARVAHRLRCRQRRSSARAPSGLAALRRRERAGALAASTGTIVGGVESSVVFARAFTGVLRALGSLSFAGM